jgi:anti-anti-sigma factor
MFEAQTIPGGRALRFSATLAMLDRAVDEAVAFLASRQAQGSLFDVKLLLREALLNAVLHGSRGDPLRQVTLTLGCADGRLTAVVADQGPGFDWRAAAEAPPPPDAESGRGLTIMALYADDVRYNAAGNQVTLQKAVPGLTGPKSPPEPSGNDIDRSLAMHDIRTEDGSTILTPAGDIVASAADGLRNAVKDLLPGLDGPLVIDLAKVELIDSVGIGLLIAVHNSLSKKGGRLTLCRVSPDLAALLRTMRLDKHFSIQPA